MGYTDVFGGETIFPSQLSYLLITTAIDIELQWPREQQIEGQNVVADFLDIDATAGSLNISMPDARNTSTGNKTTVNNVGSNDFDIVDNTGGPIVTVEPGKQWVVVLTDNSTQAGAWSTFQMGATVSTAQAAALGGAGIKPISNTLNQKIDSDEESSSPVTVVDGDRAKCLIWISGAGQVDLPDPGVVMDDWFFMIRNSGTGTLTITPPSGQIDGSSDITIEPSGSTFIFTDGTDFFTIGLTQSSVIGFDFVSIPVPGSGDFVLSGANVDRISYRFTGALTGNRRIVVPNTTQQYWCDNQTTGAFQLTISTNAQASPPELEQGETAIFYSDSVDVINAVNATSISLPLSVVQGGTGANNPTDARNNLEAAHDELDMIAGDGLIGGGLLQSDLTFAVGAGVGVGVNADDVFLDYTTVTTAVPASGDFIAFQDIDDTDITKKATISDILTAIPTIANELVDISANVRVRAETGGRAELRSDGNTDGEVRELVGTHQDGTVVWGLGQPTVSPDFVIENQLTGGAIELRSGPSSSVAMYAAGTLRAIASTLVGQFDIYADGNTATEQQLLSLRDSSGNAKGVWGWTSTEAKMHIANHINGQEFELKGFDFGGNPRTYLLADPDIDVKLFHDGVETLRTAAAASGGAEANNLSTGAGFERVLTTSDLGGGGSVYRGCKAYRSSTQNWPLNNTPNFSIPGLGAGADEVAVSFNFNLTDTEALLVHNPAINPTRFTVPPGITKAIIRAGYGIQGDTSGGYRHMRIRRNGGYLSTGLGQGSYIMHNTNSAAGSGSWWGTQFNTGVLDVNPGDFFEAYVLRQNSSGFTVFSSVWMELELLL